MQLAFAPPTCVMRARTAFVTRVRLGKLGLGVMGLGAAALLSGRMPLSAHHLFQECSKFVCPSSLA